MCGGGASKYANVVKHLCKLHFFNAQLSVLTSNRWECNLPSGVFSLGLSCQPVINGHKMTEKQNPKCTSFLRHLTTALPLPRSVAEAH